MTATDGTSYPLRLIREPAVGLPAPVQVEVALPPGAGAAALATFAPHHALAGVKPFRYFPTVPPELRQT